MAYHVLRSKIPTFPPAKALQAQCLAIFSGASPDAAPFYDEEKSENNHLIRYLQPGSNCARMFSQYNRALGSQLNLTKDFYHFLETAESTKPSPKSLPQATASASSAKAVKQARLMEDLQKWMQQASEEDIDKLSKYFQQSQQQGNDDGEPVMANSTPEPSTHSSVRFFSVEKADGGVDASHKANP
jgi:hypothetical protein